MARSGLAYVRILWPHRVFMTVSGAHENLLSPATHTLQRYELGISTCALLAGVGLIALIMVHIYFSGIRPEKRPITIDYLWVG